jgi:AraC-like DNA-binding protein
MRFWPTSSATWPAPGGQVFVRRRPRVARRLGAVRALPAVRAHEALGEPGPWVADGAVFPAAPEGELPLPCPQGAGDLHCHEKHRILLVLRGEGRLCTEDGAAALRRADVVVLPPGRLHRLETTGAPLGLLIVEFFPGAMLTASEQPLLHAVFGRRPIIRCAPAAAAEAQSLLHRIRAEQRRGREAGSLAVRAYMTSLLVLLYRRRRARGALRRSADPLLGRVRAHMEAHFRQPLRVADLAAQAHLSPRQFTARFKAAFGETPGRCLTRLRVAAAAELLSTSALGVAEIARSVGYENLSHFYRTFAQHAGTSPGRYRRQPPTPGTEGAAPGRRGATPG